VALRDSPRDGPPEIHTECGYDLSPIHHRVQTGSGVDLQAMQLAAAGVLKLSMQQGVFLRKGSQFSRLQLGGTRKFAYRFKCKPLNTIFLTSKVECSFLKK
jgi:hypothetical protein